MTGLFPKQARIFNALRSRKYRVLVAAGSTGSSKSFLTIGIIHFLCCRAKGLRFAIIRKSEKNLKQTTIPSYRKIKRLTKSQSASRMVGMKAVYHETGSEIEFVWADITKDPDLENILGLELTGALIEEAPQINRRYFDLLKTRVGRWNNDKCPPFILLNLNPSIGWCKELFYDPWCDGTLPENYYFEEFSIKDNPSLTKEFKEGLEDLPDLEYKRYVKNCWDYEDNPAQLITYEWYKQCLATYEDIGDPVKTARHQGSCDPAWEGSDKTVMGYMWDNHIYKYEEYTKQDTTTTGNLIIQRSDEMGIKQSDFILDIIGVGVGAYDTTRSQDFYPRAFVGGAGSKKKKGQIFVFKNLRSEALWETREAFKNELITVLPHPRIQKELLAIDYKVTNDKEIQIVSKRDIKKKLGFSTDYADMISMLIWNHFNNNASLSSDLFERQTQRRKEKQRAVSRRQSRRRKFSMVR